MSALVACSAVAFWYGDYWNSQNPVGMASDISGSSFGFAIVALSVGRVIMITTRIFRDKRKEEGRQQGRKEMKALVLQAIKQKREGESAEQAIERAITESWEDAS